MVSGSTVAWVRDGCRCWRVVRARVAVLHCTAPAPAPSRPTGHKQQEQKQEAQLEHCPPLLHCPLSHSNTPTWWSPFMQMRTTARRAACAVVPGMACVPSVALASRRMSSSSTPADSQADLQQRVVAVVTGEQPGHVLWAEAGAGQGWGGQAVSSRRPASQQSAAVCLHLCCRQGLGPRCKPPTARSSNLPAARPSCRKPRHHSASLEPPPPPSPAATHSLAGSCRLSAKASMAATCSSPPALRPTMP